MAPRPRTSCSFALPSSRQMEAAPYVPACENALLRARLGQVEETTIGSSAWLP